MAKTTTPPLGDAEKKDNVVTPDDKQVLIDDLKKTMHDMGRIPAIIMAPIIAYVASQYEKIPEGRREKLQTIAASLKTKGIEWLAALKTWFAENNATPSTGTSTPTTTVPQATTTTSPTTTTLTPPVVKITQKTSEKVTHKKHLEKKEKITLKKDVAKKKKGK